MLKSVQALLLVTLVASPPTLARDSKAPESKSMTAAQWRQDLEVFRQQAPNLHGNLFHSISRTQFDTAIDNVEAALPHLTSDQVKVEILRLVAMIHDGHTRVRRNTLQQHMLAFHFFYFADGLYVESADPRYKDLVGGKVLRIGTKSADEVYVAIRPLIPIDKENEGRSRLMATDLLETTEILQAIGATHATDAVSITVSKAGHDIKERVNGNSLFRPWENHGWPPDPQGWVNARAAATNSTPLWLQHSDKHYWHQYLGGGKTLYLQFNEVGDDPKGEPIARYFPSLFREADDKGVSRVILDLRLNGGGDNTLLRPIWHALLKSKNLNAKGNLFVLIGPKTFSAAVTLVAELELNTNATFVGEPTGECPNQWGDPTDLRLPNSGIVIQLSTLWWQPEDPRDDRSFIKPSVPAPLTFADYAANTDPAMIAIGESSRH